jgi:hypothetical protein
MCRAGFGLRKAIDSSVYLAPNPPLREGVNSIYKPYRDLFASPCLRAGIRARKYRHMRLSQGLSGSQLNAVKLGASISQQPRGPPDTSSSLANLAHT